MKKIVLYATTLLSIVSLAACSTNKNSNTEISESDSEKVVESNTEKSTEVQMAEYYDELLEFGQTFQKWLNDPQDTGTTVAISPDGKTVIVTLKANLSNTSDEALLSTGEMIKSLRDTVFETYLLTNDKLSKPLLDIRDTSETTYVLENEEGLLEIQ